VRSLASYEQRGEDGAKTEDNSGSSSVIENDPLYIKIHFKEPLKHSTLKPGSVLEGTLAEAVYSGEREVFPAGSTVRLTVDRLERRRKTSNDRWPWIVKTFSPRHEMQPVFSTASVVLAGDETVPLKISLISLAEKKEQRVQFKPESTNSPAAENRPNSLVLPAGVAKASERPATGGSTATFEAVPLSKAPSALLIKADEGETRDGAPPSFAAPAAISAGTEAKVILITAISASKNHRGDIVAARVVQPIRIGSGVIVPQGSLFQGRVEKVSGPRWLSRSGSLLVTFDRLTLPDGSQFPVRASVVGVDVDEASRTQIDPEGELHGGRPGRAWMLINLGASMGLAKVADDSTQLVIEAIVSTATDVSTAGVARIVGFGVSGVFMITRHGRDVMLPKYTEMRLALDEPVFLPSR
jgi:hypothetical protein